MKYTAIAGSALLGFACAIGPHAHAVAGNALTAGAASVEITPPASALKPGDTIRDPLFVRAIVIGNGVTCAVIAGADQIGLRTPVVEGAIARLARSTGCPAGNFIISATHTHSGSTGGLGAGEPGAKRVEDAIVAAVEAARARMRPARIAYGATKVDLNVNRDLFHDNGWVQGPNPDGVSDKTLAVIEILDAKDMPIAVYMNYAMHPIDFYLSGVVSADFPGEASRYIERRYPDSVAIFAQGASGDQNPRMLRPSQKLIEIRTASPAAGDLRPTATPWFAGKERNANTRQTNAMKTPVPPERMAAYKNAIQENGEFVSAMGAIIGEAALTTMAFGMTPLAGRAGIWGGNETIRCPGRDRLDKDDPIREGALPPYADGEPADIKVGLLRIGDIHMVSINGEAYAEIATRLKRESPAAHLMMVTLANGFANSGYIYSNNAGSHLTFQVIGSRLKPGCAEDKIVAASLDLIDRASH